MLVYSLSPCPRPDSLLEAPAIGPRRTRQRLASRMLPWAASPAVGSSLHNPVGFPPPSPLSPQARPPEGTHGTLGCEAVLEGGWQGARWWSGCALSVGGRGPTERDQSRVLRRRDLEGQACPSPGVVPCLRAGLRPWPEPEPAGDTENLARLGVWVLCVQAQGTSCSEQNGPRAPSPGPGPGSAAAERRRAGGHGDGRTPAHAPSPGLLPHSTPQTRLSRAGRAAGPDP